MSSDVVLIVDPLAALRRYAADLVLKASDAQPTFIEATDGASAIEAARNHSPSLVILEVAMPGMTGIQVAAEIWKHSPQTKIMLWTQHHRQIFMHELKHILNDDRMFAYVIKDSEERKLLHAIASISLHNNPYIDPSIRHSSISIKLTDGEFDVLQDMALGLTEKAIAKRRKLTIRGVQSRAASIYAKLVPEKIDDIFNRRALAFCEAIRHGLIEPESLAARKADLNAWLSAEAS